jgi:hypothetical protein
VPSCFSSRKTLDLGRIDGIDNWSWEVHMTVDGIIYYFPWRRASEHHRLLCRKGGLLVLQLRHRREAFVFTPNTNVISLSR